MKVIIAGSRNLDVSMYTLKELDELARHLYTDEGWDITEVVSGKAKGADTLGELWARLNKIPIKEFPADWDKHGKAAGPLRNREMAIYADALILFWDGKSKGSANMLKQAEKYGLLISNQSLLEVFCVYKSTIEASN